MLFALWWRPKLLVYHSHYCPVAHSWLAAPLAATLAHSLHMLQLALITSKMGSIAATREGGKAGSAGYR